MCLFQHFKHLHIYIFCCWLDVNLLSFAISPCLHLRTMLLLCDTHIVITTNKVCLLFTYSNTLNTYMTNATSMSKPLASFVLLLNTPQRYNIFSKYEQKSLNLTFFNIV